MQIDTAACWTLLESHYASLVGKSKKKQKKLEEKRPQKTKHARRVAGLCKELTDALDPLLRECVDENLLEAAVLRMADKLDKVLEDRGKEAQESYGKSLKKVQKYCKRLSESMRDACQEVLPRP